MEFRNNIFKNIRYRCNIGVVDAKFLNNVFDNVDWEPIHTNGGVVNAIYDVSKPGEENYCDNLMIVNNLSIGRQLFLPATGTGYINPNCTGAVVDYNFITSAAFGTVINQLQDHGANGGNPLVTDQGNNNYHLLFGSPAINAGTTLSSFSTDRIGVTRPAGAWDIGAYEYVSGVIDTTPPAAPSGLSVQ